MLLYLVQHGVAKSGEEDPERPLTDVGRKEAQRVVRHLSTLGIRVGHIFHSGKKRASETADIFRKLSVDKRVADAEGLAPNDSPNFWALRLREEESDIMLVGHLPHLSKLASLLLSTATEKDMIAFRNVGIVCLERDKEKDWRLKWMIIPEIIK